jgi:hypothetical protein
VIVSGCNGRPSGHTNSSAVFLPEQLAFRVPGCDVLAQGVRGVRIEGEVAHSAPRLGLGIDGPTRHDDPRSSR